MIVAEFLVIIFLISIIAGIFGSIVGLGGGVVVIPALTLLFGINIHFAIGASIVSIIGTSSGAASVYVKDKMTNLRVGMFLELATTSGAIVGAALAAYVDSSALEIIFGSILLVTLVPTVMKIGENVPKNPELKGLAKKLALTGSYTERDGSVVAYNATRPKTGLFGMAIAGMLGPLGDRWRGVQGNLHGYRNEITDEGVHDHIKLHDWSDCRRKRGYLLRPGRR